MSLHNFCNLCQIVAAALTDICWTTIDCAKVKKLSGLRENFSCENTISLKYSAYDIVPTVSAEAIDMAIKHCAKYGKGMKYIQGTAASLYSTQELHTFMCE